MTQTILDLILILHKGNKTIPEMADSLNVCTRTVYRNIRTLESIGFETDISPTGKVFLVPGILPQAFKVFSQQP